MVVIYESNQLTIVISMLQCIELGTMLKNINQICNNVLWDSQYSLNIPIHTRFDMEWEYLGIFHVVMWVPHNIVTNMNNAMLSRPSVYGVYSPAPPPSFAHVVPHMVWACTMTNHFNVPPLTYPPTTITTLIGGERRGDNLTTTFFLCITNWLCFQFS